MEMLYLTQTFRSESFAKLGMSISARVKNPISDKSKKLPVIGLSLCVSKKIGIKIARNLRAKTIKNRLKSTI